MPTIPHVRVTWIRSELRGRIQRTVVSHPWQWEVTEPDGYQRYFDRKAEAQAWIDANYPPAQLTPGQAAYLTELANAR